MFHGNILVRRPPDDGFGMVLALTNFESGGGPYFNTRPNEIEVYMNTDIVGVHGIEEGLVTICEYLEDVIGDTLDLHNVLEDFNHSMETLLSMKKNKISNLFILSFF
jgi:hypothetical protein